MNMALDAMTGNDQFNLIAVKIDRSHLTCPYSANGRLDDFASGHISSHAADGTRKVTLITLHLNAV